MPAAMRTRLALALLAGLAMLPAAVHAERSDWRQLSVGNSHRRLAAARAAGG